MFASGMLQIAATEPGCLTFPCLAMLQVDVYSFGVVLWELWERRRPFEDLRSRFDIADTVTAGGRPTIGRGCPSPYAALVRRCWHQVQSYTVAAGISVPLECLVQ